MATSTKKTTSKAAPKRRTAANAGPDGTVKPKTRVSEADRKANEADGQQAEPVDDSKASITVEPTKAGMGAPIRIRAKGIAGDIITRLHGTVGQTLSPNGEGIALATFQYPGVHKVRAKKAKGRGWVEAEVTIV